MRVRLHGGCYGFRRALHLGCRGEWSVGIGGRGRSTYAVQVSDSLCGGVNSTIELLREIAIEIVSYVVAHSFNHLSSPPAPSPCCTVYGEHGFPCHGSGNTTIVRFGRHLSSRDTDISLLLFPNQRTHTLMCNDKGSTVFTARCARSTPGRYTRAC